MSERLVGDALVVVLAVLDVVPPHDLDLAEVRVLLPLRGGCYGELSCWGERGTTYVEKVDLFEEFLFVVLELADHGERGRRVRANTDVQSVKIDGAKKC